MTQISSRHRAASSLLNFHGKQTDFPQFPHLFSSWPISLIQQGWDMGKERLPRPARRSFLRGPERILNIADQTNFCEQMLEFSSQNARYSKSVSVNLSPVSLCAPRVFSHAARAVIPAESRPCSEMPLQRGMGGLLARPGAAAWRVAAWRVLDQTLGL